MSNKKHKKISANFRKLENERTRLISLLLSETELIEGNLSEILVRCGRKGCHCEEKPAHPITRLGVREKGKITNKVVRVADRELVRKQIQVYKEFKSMVKKVERLENQEKVLLHTLRKLRHKGYV